MKKINILIGISVFCFSILFMNDIVHADTINANDLNLYDLLHENDVIEFGSGNYKGYSYNSYEIWDVGVGGDHTVKTSFGETSYTVIGDCYVDRICVKSFEPNRLLIELCEYVPIEEPRTITVNEGDSVILTTNVLDVGNNEFEYQWYLGETTISDRSPNLSTYKIENITSQMSGNKYTYSVRSTTRDWGLIPIKDNGIITGDKIYTTIIVRPKVEEVKEEKEEKPHNEPTKTPEQIESERKNKDTLPSGTIQGIGGKKDFNFKALNPVQRDVNNQQIFADYYAKQLGFKSELLISKDIYAPYGQTKESKWQSRTISWKNTGAKFGDLIYVVWYCQEAHEMQFIQANVLPDGTVVFTIPKSGDVSTISIVKLNK